MNRFDEKIEENSRRLALHDGILLRMTESQKEYREDLVEWRREHKQDIRWMIGLQVGTWVTIVGGLAGIIGFMLKLLQNVPASGG